MALFSLKNFKAERRQKIVSEFSPAPEGVMAEYYRLAKKYKVSYSTVIMYVREAKKEGKI